MQSVTPNINDTYLIKKLSLNYHIIFSHYEVKSRRYKKIEQNSNKISRKIKIRNIFLKTKNVHSISLLEIFTTASDIKRGTFTLTILNPI